MNLVLFTTFYPYVTGAEQNFVEVESEYLSKRFERIIIIPSQKGAKEITQLADNPNIDIENGYSRILAQSGRIRIFLRGIFSYLTYLEIIKNPKLILKPTYVKRLLFFAGLAEITYSWLKIWIKNRNLNLENTLFYTYWFDYTATGLALTKYFNRSIKFISRAHGYDVYDERNTPPYWPCRFFTLKQIEYLFPDSVAGTNYLHHKYPQFSSQIETARLGILDPQISTKPSPDNVIRVVSCSRMVAVKRLDLLLDAMLVLALKNTNVQFSWCHFGDGELRKTLEDKLKDLPTNLKIKFPGYTTQSDLFTYYKETPVDVFVNVSQSEGTPVAVMEAISCGIPIVATGVGGNKEIVTEQNGILLRENPTPKEIGRAILEIKKLDTKRQGSRQVWQSQYNAHLNFLDFSEKLEKILLS